MAKEEIEKTTDTEEKKPNAFSKFWNKTKQAVGDSMLEAKLDSEFRKSHDEFTVYEYEKMLGKTYAGTLEDNKVTLYGELEISSNSVVVEKKKGTPYYVVSTEKTEVTFDLDGESYTRPATTVLLDKDVTEVKVIKAGDKYYVYKG